MFQCEEALQTRTRGILRKSGPGFPLLVQGRVSAGPSSVGPRLREG